MYMYNLKCSQFVNYKYKCTIKVNLTLFNRILFFDLQLQKSVTEYDTLSLKFSALYQTSFDADPTTLQSIILYPFLHVLVPLLVSYIFIHYFWCI